MLNITDVKLGQLAVEHQWFPRNCNVLHSCAGDLPSIRYAYHTSPRWLTGSGAVSSPSSETLHQGANTSILIFSRNHGKVDNVQWKDKAAWVVNNRPIPKIYLFGNPEIPELEGKSFFPSKGFQLLALLALTPGHRLKRRAAANLLWESSSNSLAFANLRQLISRIRKALPEEEQVLSVDAGEISLVEMKVSTIDLCQFEECAKSGDMPEALRLFRGELLDCIDDVSELFLDWLIQSRVSLRERLFAVAEDLLTEITRYGRASKVEIEEIGAQMLALEPEREQSYRKLIEAYGRSGYYGDARRSYELLKSMLAAEYGVAPSLETAATVRSVFATASAVGTRPEKPNTLGARPRVAFLAPIILTSNSSPALLRALIEDVSNELTRYRSFVVLAPHSSFQVEHDSGIPSDNDSLCADYTISGFVKPDTNGSALALRMANCRTGEIVWTGEFSFAPEDLRKFFRNLSLRVAASLAAGLETEMYKRALYDPALKAYQSFLTGQECMAVCDLPHLRRARKAYEGALAEDGSYAAAQARLSQTLFLEWLIRGADTPEIVVAARQRAQLAREMDPNDAMGHWIGGAIAFYQRDFDESTERFSIAETLSPNSADLLVEYANALSHLGHIGAGSAMFERAVSLNPMPPDHYWWAGASITFNANELERTIEYCTRMKNEGPTLRLLTASYALAGDEEKARACAERLRESYPDQSAEDMVGISPDSDSAVTERFIHGLHLAGIK